jgi:hypothetical protein
MAAVVRTTNQRFPLPDFGDRNWDQYYREFVNSVDALMTRYFVISSYTGVWDNATAYAAGDRALDTSNDQVYSCLLAHASATSPTTFLEDRTANTTYWESFTVEDSFQGTWVTGTAYIVRDWIVYQNQYAVCLEAHTSGTFATDVTNVKWVVVVDLSADVAATAADAVSTAADLVLTDADTVATAADAVSTDSDKDASAVSAATATTKASAASTSATASATSATAAATSATTATTQASAASTSASGASTSASSASTSATAAAASYDSFDDRYLGAKSSDPTEDNDGNSLLTGALYYNTTSSVMKVYSGSAWAAIAASDVSTFMLTVLDDANAAAATTTLGVGTGDSPTFTGLTLSGFEYLSMTTGITAGTTQTQAGAVALTTQTNRVTVSGTDADAVKLPTAVANALVTVINDDAAQTIAVWPNTSDTIDGGSANAVDGNTLAAGNSRTYLAYDATNWVTVTNAPSAAFDPDGAQTFNTSAADVDFIVKTDDNAVAFKIDGGLRSGVGAIGMGRAPISTAQLVVGHPAFSHDADQSHYGVAIAPAGAVTIPSGTAAIATSLYIIEPNITATGTVTVASTVHIADAPTEGTNNYALFVDAGNVRFDGSVVIGEGGPEAKVTRGLTINNPGSPSIDQVLAFRSVGQVDHGVTGASGAETDIFGFLRKVNGTRGGLRVQGITDDYGSAMEMAGIAPAPDSGHSTLNAYAVVRVVAEKADGTGTQALADGENMFSCWNLGTARFLIQGDGNIHGDTSAVVLDCYDDAALIRANELERSIDKGIEDQVLPSRFDANQYEKETIEEMGYRCPRISDEDWADGSRPLYSITKMNDLVKGAIWQSHEMLDAFIEAVEAIHPGFTEETLRPKFVERGLPCQILDWDGPIPDDLTVNHEPPPAFNE